MEWINVNDKLPHRKYDDCSEKVLIAQKPTGYESYFYAIGRYNRTYEIWVEEYTGKTLTFVTHWMQFESPEEQPSPPGEPAPAPALYFNCPSCNRVIPAEVGRCRYCEGQQGPGNETN